MCSFSIQSWTLWHIAVNDQRLRNYSDQSYGHDILKFIQILSFNFEY